MKTPKIDDVWKGHLEVRMTLNGNQSTTGMSPRYEISQVYEGGIERPVVRFAVQPRNIGYTVDAYSYIDGGPRQVVGFTFTQRSADKMAHGKTLRTAQRIASNFLTVEIRDKSAEDIQSLLKGYRELGSVHPTDINGKSLEAKFARRTQ